MQAKHDSDIPGTVAWERTRAERAEALIAKIQGALNTEETGDALVEVARNACRAEQELASMVSDDTDEDREILDTVARHEEQSS